MTLKLNTSICPIVCIGTYGTMLSPDSIFDGEEHDWEEAHNEGLITKEELDYLIEASWSNFDGEKYLNALGEYALHELEDFFKDNEHFIKAELASKDYATYSPREYNFSTDGMDYFVKVERPEMDRLARELRGNEEFLRWIKDTYGHRSGFISFMPFDKNDFFEALAGKDAERALSMYLMWLLKTEHGHDCWDNPYQDNLVERFAMNNSLSEFVSDEKFNEILEKTWR